MNTFDYMNLVKWYFIKKIENKNVTDCFDEIKITSKREEQTNNLYYVVEQLDDNNERLFYLKFFCNNKYEFYEAINLLLIEYFVNNDNLLYTSTRNDEINGKTFSFVSSNLVSITFNIEDELDSLIFLKFKEFIDKNCEFKGQVESFDANKKILVLYPENLEVAVS